jgi:hypothetical protein
VLFPERLVKIADGWGNLSAARSLEVGCVFPNTLTDRVPEVPKVPKAPFWHSCHPLTLGFLKNIRPRIEQGRDDY